MIHNFLDFITVAGCVGPTVPKPPPPPPVPSAPAATAELQAPRAKQDKSTPARRRGLGRFRVVGSQTGVAGGRTGLNI